MRLVFALLVLALPLPAAVFVAPDETKPLLQRDLLPIDTDTMRALSAQLTNLARREVEASPAQFRATAQLLAIATRLDPANRAARDLARSLANSQPAAPVEAAQFEQAKAGSWQIVDWLLQEEAGPEGQLFGHQLLDALHVLDPAHPASKRHDPAGEARRWDGVVASLDQFKDPPPSTAVPTPPSPLNPPPEPPPPPINPIPVQLREAKLTTPLYLYDSLTPDDGSSEYRLRLRLVPITMRIAERPETGPLKVSLVPEYESNALETVRTHLTASLQQTWSGMPIDEHATFATDRGRYASRNGTAMSGPVALLLHAALAGRSLRSDLVFLGELKDDGTLTRPRLSWEYLDAIRSADRGGRLLVPPDLLPELRAFLVQEEPAFFVRWEILAVDSLDDALSRGTVEGDSEALAAASSLFSDVQAVARLDVGEASVNKGVRERLAEIREKAPFHLSASMILLQGSSSRPTRLDREVLARILRSAVEPLSSISHANTGDLSAARLAAARDSSRRMLAPLSKRAAKADLDLLDEATALVDLADALTRVPNVTTENGASPLFGLHRSFKARYPAFLAKLAPYTGEVVSPQAPNAPPVLPAGLPGH